MSNPKIIATTGTSNASFTEKLLKPALPLEPEPLLPLPLVFEPELPLLPLLPVGLGEPAELDDGGFLQRDKNRNAQASG